MTVVAMRFQDAARRAPPPTDGRRRLRVSHHLPASALLLPNSAQDQRAYPAGPGANGSSARLCQAPSRNTHRLQP